MKPIHIFYAIALCISCHFPLVAQNCTAGCTVTINISGSNSSTYNLNDNDVVCITGSGTFSGGFNMNGDNVVICIDENITVTNSFNQRSNTVIELI